MAVAIDPVISNVFFTLGLIPHAAGKKDGYYSPRMDKPLNLPLVTVLIPLYKEPYEIIKNLFSCLMNQTYDHAKMELIIVTEPDDEKTNIHVEKIVSNTKDGFAAVKHLVTDGMMKMKPYALNWGLDRSSGNIIGIYDAECEPEPEQVMKAVYAIFEQDYDLVQAKIEVESENILGELYKLDIYMWQELYLPVINEKANCFPMASKGLFIKKEILKDIGGFPLHLTEDAMMSILLAPKNRKFGLLESVTKEKSTRTWRVHFKQRRRWFRGYLSCLWELMKVDMPLKKKFWLSIPYVSPILCSLSLLGFIFLFMYFISWTFFPAMIIEAPWMRSIIYDKYLSYWSLFLGYIGLPFTIISYLYSIADVKLEKKALYVYLIPVYWIFLGISAMASFFKDDKNWDKTEREV